MNLRECPQPAPDNDKVVNPLLDLKLWPEEFKRKRTLKLQAKSLPGWCIKKSAMGSVEVAKPLDDNDRKMQFSGAMDSTSELQGFSKNSGARRLKEINEGSCKRKIVSCPNASTSPNDSILKVVDPSFKKYPKHLRIEGVLCLKDHPAKFLKWPESIRKKRSSSGLNQLSDTLENTLVCLGKRQKVSGEKFRTLSGHSLPEEVLEEILSRLPVKSVARFRCVCKLWNHLSQSKRFISLHLKNYRTIQLLLGTCCVVKDCCSMYFLPPLPRIGGYSDNDGASQEMVKHDFPALFGGSCNGIVCLYAHYSTTNIVLWNPATNESKTIPDSEFPLIPKSFLGKRSLSYNAVGFGFDPKTNDYKILQMVYDKPKPHVTRMKLYSLRKGSWKKVDCHEFMVVRNLSAGDIVCSLPFTDNRIVCAVVSPINGARKWEILWFDMSREKYEIIPVSPSLDDELGELNPLRFTRSRFFKLFPFKETIAFGIAYRVDSGSGSYCDIWMLNNFDSTNIQSRCWSKCFSTKIIYGNSVPIGCWGSSQILFQDRSYNALGPIVFKDKAYNGLARLDLDKNMMVELGVFHPLSLTPVEYKESLVRINDIKEDEDSKCL